MKDLDIVRHSLSHIMAYAVKELFPDTKFAIGPSIDNGFYYDFEPVTPFTFEDVNKIQKKMEKLIAGNLAFEKSEVTKEEAREIFKGQPYKLELIEDIEGDIVTLYKVGDFIDLCKGPHIESTKELMSVGYKLYKTCGAYWRGNEKNKMLSRIYGYAFSTKEELKEYIAKQEDALKRDHNKLGRDLEIFSTVDYIGQGLPIFLPRGTRLFKILSRWVEDEEESRGYLQTRTPLMAKSDLYKISEHWYHYKENMFILGDEEKDKEVLALRPMTCPFQFQAYLNKPRSYRDLPMRLNETSTLFRNEDSGEMHGLIRVRQFTISEGHLLVTPEQLEDEFKGCLDLARFMLKSVGLEEDVTYRFSKWDSNNKEKYMGSSEEWERVQDVMRNILDDLEINYQEAEGEAAFYGPKLDIQVKNVFGKEDTLITIQIDFQLAKKFEMTYIDRDGQKKYPYVIHRTSIGCYERTIALLIEKYAGAFPFWFSPEQIAIVPVSENNYEYAKQVQKLLKEKGFRVEIDLSDISMGKKVNNYRKIKVPYVLILGDSEQENKTISLKTRTQKQINNIEINKFIEICERQNKEKILQLTEEF